MREVHDKSTDKAIDLAVESLKAGKLVSFPTETVYGLGAHARNSEAVAKVFQAKGRPSSHPLIVHIPSSKHLSEWAIDIPDAAWLLAKYFWPGPLTLILKKHPSVSSTITGGQDTIGIRVPQHPMTLELLRRLNSGLVGPSANSYGQISPTLAQHVEADLGHKVDYILEGGPCVVGIESTILYLGDPNRPSIMRQGTISAAEISQVLGFPIATEKASASIRVPGAKSSHYAPSKPLYLVEPSALSVLTENHLNNNSICSVLSFHEKPSSLPDRFPWYQVSKEPVQYAQQLYSNLRKLDANSLDKIFVETVPHQTGWTAIADRLQRASQDIITQVDALVTP